jgi:DNA-directed RNA polymerase specialized sigma24 family protein
MGFDTSIELLARWRAGDERAADKLFSRNTSRLIAMTRNRLSTKLARRIDAEDVVQSAYRCFCSAARTDRIILHRSGDLGRLLAKMTLRKLYKQIEHHTAAKRAVGRDETFRGDSGLIALCDVAARTPSPSARIAVAEDLDQALKGLAPHQRQMVELRLQGYLIQEIARATDRSERLVRRVIDQVKDRLIRLGCAPPNK